MKVLLLNPYSRFTKNLARDLLYGCWCRGKRIAGAQYPPLSLISIAPILTQGGHKVELLDAQAEQLNLETTTSRASDLEPSVIIIPTSSFSFKEDASTLEHLKAELGCTTVVFGSHPTFMPMESLRPDAVDFIVRGEPELATRDLVDGIEKESYAKVRGIGYKEKGRPKINPPHPLIEDLSALPFPDRSLIPDVFYFNPLVERFPWTTALTSRGCPGKCVFCSSPNFYGRRFRLRTADSVVEEMLYLINKGFKEVFYRDETFTANRRRVRSICEKILKERLDVTWICNTRVGLVDRELMELMLRAGCHTLKVGVESGEQRILDNLKKGISIEDTRRLFTWAHETGMKTHAHVMLGCIGETEDSLKRTIRFVKEMDPTTVTFNIFTPFPGTEIFQMLTEKTDIGDGTGCDLQMLHTKSFFTQYFCEIPPERLEKALIEAYREFYIRPDYLWKRLSEIRSFADLSRLVRSGIDIITFSLL